MSEQKQEEVPWWRNHPWLGRHLFMENRNKYCYLLLKYEDMTVAWFPDGSGIRDVDVDEMAMRKRIEDAGVDPSWYNYEYVEPQARLIVSDSPAIPGEPTEANRATTSDQGQADVPRWRTPPLAGGLAPVLEESQQELSPAPSVRGSVCRLVPGRQWNS